jgi:protein-L-isoaspartate(D-aspartate) O-methyltransferase
MNEMNFEQARFNMIEQQVRPWNVLDQRVLDVMAAVPREHFVPARYRALAFADVSIPLNNHQVMMHPNVEGRLLQALALHLDDNVLEIGTGSGYLTACMARLARRVVSVEIFPEFTEAARQKVRAYGTPNIQLHTGDAANGWGEHQYDAIAITGSLPVLPDLWGQHLTLGGRLFVVVGGAPIMEATLVTRLAENEWATESLFDTDLPPLINSERPVKFAF